MRTITPYAPLFTASLLCVALLLVPACGGCPWTSASAVSVSPATTCLALNLADGSGDAPSTGCVDPVLYGVNRCNEPLVLPADPTTAAAEQRVEPKASFTYEVRLNYCNTVGENYHAKIPATLGAAAVMIEFDLYAP